MSGRRLRPSIGRAGGPFVLVGMANRTKLTQRARETFHDVLSSGRSISAACRAAGISRQTYYDWREVDAEFRQMTDDAYEAGTDHYEDVAADRAEDRSDTLLLAILKARRPDRYRDTQKLEHSGRIDSALTVVIGERPDGPQ